MTGVSFQIRAKHEGDDEKLEGHPVGVPKKVASWLVVVVSAVAMFCVAQILHDRISSTPTRQLVRLSNQINAGLPQQVDQETHLDTTFPGPGNRFTYLYTPINVANTNFDRAEFEGRMKPMLLNAYKTHQMMERFRKAQVELHYTYRNRDGNEVATIVVSPKDF